jgi:hypothetical protein
MASASLVDQVDAMSKRLKQIARLLPNEHPLRSPKGQKNAPAFLFEFKILLEMLRALKQAGWTITVERRDGQIRFARAPRSKSTSSFFRIVKAGTAFQVTQGTQVADRHGEPRAPDICLQAGQAGENPTYKDVLAIWDAKLRGRTGRLLEKLMDRLREIRNELGTDQVFDVVGEVFPANLLERLFRDLYARRLDVPTIEDRIVRDVSPQRFRAITNSALEGLARKSLNLSNIVGKSVEARERRLVPEVIEQFFVEASPVVGVQPQATARDSHIYRVGRVPRNLLPMDEFLHEGSQPIRECRRTQTSRPLRSPDRGRVRKSESGGNAISTEGTGGCLTGRIPLKPRLVTAHVRRAMMNGLKLRVSFQPRNGTAVKSYCEPNKLASNADSGTSLPSGRGLLSDAADFAAS